MGRRLPIIQLNRRQFVLGSAALGLIGCGPVEGPGDGGTSPDSGTEPDAGSVDAGPPPMCPGSTRAAIDTGKTPAEFVAGTPTFIGRALAFVIRDAGGLYAMTSVCTHGGCSVVASGSGFSCPCHNSRFTAEGTATVGPATLPLVHYALCLSDRGTVAVDPSMVVDKATRLEG